MRIWRGTCPNLHLNINALVAMGALAKEEFDAEIAKGLDDISLLLLRSGQRWKGILDYDMASDLFR